MYSVFTCRYWRYIMVRLIKHQQLLGEYCMNVSIEEFTHFDFQLVPEPSPLDLVITESLKNHIEVNGVKSGALLPLPFQTGIGKTYTALNFLLQQMLEQVRSELKEENPAKNPNACCITLLIQ